MVHKTTIKTSELLKEYWEHIQHRSVENLCANLIDPRYKDILSRSELLDKYEEARKILDTTLTGTFDNGTTINISCRDASPYGYVYGYCLNVKNGNTTYSEGGCAYDIWNDDLGLTFEVDGGDIYKVSLVTD